MYSLQFPAILKTNENEWLEEGTAFVSIENNSIEFTNNFVPLMKLGTKVKIIRVEKEYETHCFEGEVYLSSRNLLRITAVTDHILEDARCVFPIKTSIDTQITRIELGFSPRISNATERYGINIYSLSMKEILFTSDHVLEQSQRFSLALEEPLILQNVVLQIYRCVFFGNNSFAYLCNIIAIPENSKETLEKYLDGLMQTQPSIFASK